MSSASSSCSSWTEEKEGWRDSRSEGRGEGRGGSGSEEKRFTSSAWGLSSERRDARSVFSDSEGVTSAKDEPDWEVECMPCS